METKGKTLEETAALFDGKEAIQNIENVGHEALHRSRHQYDHRPFAKRNRMEMELSISKPESDHSVVVAMESEQLASTGRDRSREEMQQVGPKKKALGDASTEAIPRIKRRW